MKSIPVASRRITQTVRGEALPQTHWQVMHRRVTPLSHPRSRRLFLHRMADLVAVMCWTIAAVGICALIYSAAQR